MEDRRILSALSYLSIFFAPFIAPIIIWLVSQDSDVRRHAKRALISHIIPIGLGLLAGVFFLFTTIFGGAQEDATLFFAGFGGMLLYGLVYLGFVIWNIVQAVLVFRNV
ncbi:MULTISPECIES: DUF4870 domain-containing protein [Bacillales]|uniref:DUF4870 domain-containing protein n=1 Tax=Lysinibacillus louembei TaxID=1470088 RepID=A0ABZ0S331_9BACI|nr:MULTISPECIES: DUF4870 domain-containing protein [Bacillales]MCT6923871.1 DUF4870 domain-containing protein [Metasolibacillus sp.]MCT6940409.1 DUF4870 domain-containing protein [Metasolibacillus sp.]WPK13729.1 DUF4870 domain-containing protein [Lysinibacillus louembei]